MRRQQGQVISEHDALNLLQKKRNTLLFKCPLFIANWQTLTWPCRRQSMAGPGSPYQDILVSLHSLADVSVPV